MEEAIGELKIYIKDLFDKLEQKIDALEKKKPTPSKKTPAKKTPTKPISLEKAYQHHSDGLKNFIENGTQFQLLCTYVKKSGEGAGKASALPATHILAGDDPNKRVAVPLPTDNPIQAVIDHFGPDPKASFAYLRSNKNSKVCLNDSISKSVEFVGMLDNGAVVHAEETSPSDEAIAASLSGKPMSPERNKLMTPEDMIIKPEDASGPAEPVSLPVVEDASFEHDNGDLEQLLSSLN